MLGPWLTQPSLGMVYGWRGSGKTWFSLSVAYAVASGGDFLRWTAKAPSRVMYVDGEMGKAAIQQRQRFIFMGADKGVENGRLFYYTFQDNRGVIPNLADTADWHIYNKLIENVHLLIIDNICCCVRPLAKQTEVEAWATVQEWAINQRGKGKSILFVHHSGKSGSQLGTSTREQPMDYVIALRRPANVGPEAGCVFELHFEKNRGFFGDDVTPLYVRLEHKDTGLSWSYSTLYERQKIDVIALKERCNAYSVSDIAELTGLSTMTVKRILSESTLMDHVRSKRNGADEDENF